MLTRRTGRWAIGLATVLAVSGLSAAGANAQSTNAQPGPVTTCASVGVGAKGPAVRTIQTLVGADVDGDFGPLTTAALKIWQHRHDVAVTGVVDVATWAAMPARVARAACGQKAHGTGVAATCSQLTTGATGVAVAVLQKALGVDVDGIFGAATEQAVLAAQTKGQLPITGTVAQLTWTALGKNGTPACQVPPPPAPTATTPTPTPSPTPAPAPHLTRKQRAHLRAEQAIADKTVTLAAALLDSPGTTHNPVALKTLAFATKQTGKPYKWGGTGPKSYDCSGLVMASYLHSGLTLPRVAADQYGAGPTVPLDQAVQGDLLFYASDLTKPSTIYHVVMYAGDGTIIDAPYTGAFVGTRPLWTSHLLPVAVRPVAQLSLPLRPGATGWTVGQLQQELNRHGAGLTVDGGYGPSTVSAVKAWKAKHGLSGSGLVNRKTWLTFG